MAQEPTPDSAPTSSADKIRQVLWILCVIGATAAAVQWSRGCDKGRAPATLESGGQAPDFTLTTVEGTRRVSVSDHRGKVVLLDFWATWCSPCLRQMPVVQALADDESLDDTLAIVSVNTDQPNAERLPKVRAFLDEHEHTFTTVLDNGSASGAFRIVRLPTLVVISPDGDLVYGQSGVHSEQTLRELIAKAQSFEPTDAKAAGSDGQGSGH